MVDVPAVVIKDSAAPTGTFSVAPSTAWATLTTVTVTPLTLVDNWTPPADVSGQVFWGDGSSDPFTGLTPVTHVYSTGGTRTPTVTLSDEAHNLSGDLSTSAVVVSVDKTGPKVKLTVPSAKHSVKAWKTLRGTATDAGTGVKSVWLKAVEKRHSGVVRLQRRDAHLGQGRHEDEGIQEGQALHPDDERPAPLDRQAGQARQGHAGLQGPRHRPGRQPLRHGHPYREADQVLTPRPRLPGRRHGPYAVVPARPTSRALTSYNRSPRASSWARDDGSRRRFRA